MDDLPDELVIADPDDPSGATILFVVVVNFVLGIMFAVAICKWIGILP
jgi:hypothetical protein